MTGQACVICGSNQGETLESATGSRMYCRACFHSWRLEQPVFSYSNTAMCSLGTSDERLASQVGFFAHAVGPESSVLEIGCATGELSRAVRSRLGVKRYDAIELSPAGETAKPGLDQLFTEPLGVLLEKGEIDPGYDAVLISHVLEHIVDPVAELKAIRKVLSPGGVIFIEVPNMAGSRALPIDDNVSHLHFFSLQSVMRMLANEGLEAIASETGAVLDARYSDSIRVLARPFALPRWSTTLLSDHPALNGEPIVVWGAGSLVDEILANFFDPTKIDFFIDHDPAKQGAQRLGRPVRGPDSLGDQPRTVLVNSIDFADSIAADVARRYPGVEHRLIRIGSLLN